MAIPLIYPFANPAYRMVTQPFGPVSNQFEPPYPDSPQTELWVSTNGAQGTAPAIAHYHRGTDFAVPEGTDILAAADGTVEYAGVDPYGSLSSGYGNMAGIKHAGGLCTLYGHFKSLSVSTGDTVTQGHKIGVSDSTGSSTGAHLHLGVNTLGSVFNDSGWTNPIPLLGDAAIANPVPYLSPDGSVQPNATAPGYVTVAQAVYYARSAGFPEDEVATAAAIAQAESSLAIGAISPVASDGGRGYGLWQIQLPAHKEYVAPSLTTDPLYNARAAYAVWQQAGNSWKPWTTYGYRGTPPAFIGWGKGAFVDYLPAAQTAQQQTPFGQFPQSNPSAAPIPIDNAPELPVDIIQVETVTIDRSALKRTPGLLPTAALRIAGAMIPVSSCSFTEPQYRTAGSWQATVPVDIFDRVRGGDQALSALFARLKTQVTIQMGYVQPDRNGKPNPSQAPDVFTGLAYIPEIDDASGTVTLKGPDLSGIFSDQGATASKLGSFTNMPADKAIRTILNRHFKAGQGKIDAVIEATAGTVGGLFGQDAVQTRTPVRTEWDLILSIADGQGMVAYFRGTTLYVRHVPDTDTLGPLVLYHRLPDQPGPLVAPRFRPQVHSKRDYNVISYSYDTRRGQVRSAVAGNTDSPNTVPIFKSPNYTQDDLQKKADAVFLLYSGMEYQADLSFVEPVDLVPAQAIVIQTGAPYSLYKRVMGPDHKYYVVTSTMSYDLAKGGISMSAQCSNRPPGVTDRNTAGQVGF